MQQRIGIEVRRKATERHGNQKEGNGKALHSVGKPKLRSEKKGRAMMALIIKLNTIGGDYNDTS